MRILAQVPPDRPDFADEPAGAPRGSGLADSPDGCYVLPDSATERSVVLRRILTAALTITLALAFGGTLFGSPGWSGVRLDPARTWVGLARVYLEVSELRVENDSLVGTYRIRVPLAPNRDDRGTVRFALAQPLDQVLVEGAVLLGQGKSSLSERTHRIRCAFGEAASVRIEVDTGDRRLSFRSRWSPGT